MAYKAII